MAFFDVTLDHRRYRASTFSAIKIQPCHPTRGAPNFSSHVVLHPGWRVRSFLRGTIVWGRAFPSDALLPFCLPMLQYRSLTPTVYARVGDLFRERFGDRAGWAHSLLFAAELPGFKASTIFGRTPNSRTKVGRSQLDFEANRNN